MSQLIDDLLVDVRRSYRLVHSYQRRLLDALRPAVDAVRDVYPDLRHIESKSYALARPMPKQDPTLGKWAWDYLPLAFADLTWATAKRPQDQAVHLSVRHNVDSGFRKEHGREPDAQDFVDARECSTLIEPVLIRVLGAPTQRDWGSLYGDAEEKTEYVGWTDGMVRSIALGPVLIRFAGLQVNVSTLGCADDVQRHLVAPMAQLAQALL